MYSDESQLIFVIFGKLLITIDFNDRNGKKVCYFVSIMHKLYIVPLNWDYYEHFYHILLICIKRCKFITYKKNKNRNSGIPTQRPRIRDLIIWSKFRDPGIQTLLFI